MQLTKEEIQAKIETLLSMLEMVDEDIEIQIQSRIHKLEIKLQSAKFIKDLQKSNTIEFNNWLETNQFIWSKEDTNGNIFTIEELYEQFKSNKNHE